MTQLQIFTGHDYKLLELEINKFLYTKQFISSSITYANSTFIILVYYKEAPIK